ncbi:E3 ubiquitin-protein ligase RNF43, partial [Pelecanus crispus]
VLQSHPLSLCNTSEDEHTESGFITIVKLEQPDRDPNPCLSLANKAKLAGERGARAILFDITDDESAADQLRKPRGLSQPVVLIRGHDAELLMGVVNKNREAHVKIEVKEPPAWPDYDVWILLTVVSTVVVIILIFVVRTKCQLNRTQDSLQQQTMQAIGQLATRKYQARCRQASRWDSASSCSSAPVCAICLEEFSEGQELRIISCSHEFHRECVDPWLQQHHTCPLCMFNILARDSDQATATGSRLAPRDMEPGRRLHLFRQHPGHALYHLPHAYPQRNLRSFPLEPAHGNPFFHSPELSQLDFGTIHYMPYRPATSLLTCAHPSPLAQGLLAQHHPNPSVCGQTLPPHRTCSLQPQPPCLGLKTALAQKQHRHVHYHHHQHHHYRRDGEGPPGRAGQGPGQRKSRYSGAKVGFHSARTQKRAEKSPQQPLESRQPACPQQGREPPHAPSASPKRLDFSVDANRPSGAAGTSTVPLPPRHSLQSRHHRRKRKCPLEPEPGLLPEDSALPKACDAHIPHGHPAGYRCSPEVQPLIPSALLPCGLGSRPLWKCLVP